MVLKPFAIAALSLLITYLFTKLRFKRFKQYAHLPQLPPSLIWGHMLVYDEISKHAQRDRHPDLIFAEMYEKLGRPPLIFLDMRPISKPVALITSHDIAEQVTKSSNLFPWSTPKTPTMKDIIHLLGPSSLNSAEGEEWRRLRKRFAPGFAPNQLITLLPCILDKTEPFINRLEDYVRSGEQFSLLFLTVNLTIDVISAVAMEEDLGAQSIDPSGQSQVIRLFMELLSTYSSKYNRPWWLDPSLGAKRRRLAEQVDGMLRDIVRRKFDEHQRTKQGDKSRSILSLSFQDIDELTPELLSHTSDQLKSFFFAGHDTTSILLSWTFYELSRSPRVQKAVRAELDELFGPDPDPSVVRSKLYANGEDLVRRMTTWGFTPSAWRPFERGPRNCIGQELANIEARVIIAIVARQFAFVKVGLGELDLDENDQPVLNDKDQYKVKSELYPMLQVTVKPVDGMMMKVKHAQQQCQ
ncbi:hypothetical protein BHE90_000370 [Fusarium euwallaceae]|uniref:Cytochrome P450 n=1 Tax=Fusarium euwallaceae TaxID=1147111 RepID=A0A430MAD4_9HYPO|nr:hypothetical protein BHE90_000370 [Fusarium euwallaceae]